MANPSQGRQAGALLKVEAALAQVADADDSDEDIEDLPTALERLTGTS